MVRRIALLLVASLLLANHVVDARLCASDKVPAATLLVPYFEVDLDACGVGGRNARIDIVNASNANTIAHVTVWSDWSVPLLNFDLYLTGLDVETLDMADILCAGNLPVTGRTVSPHGPVSEPIPGSGAFPTCEIVLPYSMPAVPASFLTYLQNGLTGRELQPLQPGQCAGSDRESNLARGYLTIDVVNDCTLLMPSDIGYFAGVASNENRLLGDYRLVDDTEINLTAPLLPPPLPGTGPQSRSAVHIEADGDGDLLVAGDRTFYGRYVDGDASDRREPLPSTFAIRYALGAAAAPADLFVWREGTADAQAVACGTSPTGVPLDTRDLLFFDDQESPTLVPAAATSEVEVLDLVALAPAAAQIGWLQLDLGHSGVGAIYGDSRAQAWVSFSNGLTDGSLAGGDAKALDNLCPGHQTSRTVAP